MRSLNTLNSIHNNQNIVWDYGAYSLITKMHTYYIISNIGQIHLIRCNKINGLEFLFIENCLTIVGG